MSDSKVRISGIDIIKIIACIFVISLHFTSYYYVETTNTIGYVLSNSFKWLTFSCISLFMISTGYLNCEKKLDKRYVKKFLSFVVVFLVYSIVTGFVINKIGDKSLFNFIIDNIKWYFLGYSSYFWYVNFYFSIFFLIPFLGIINKNINQKQHLFLILLLIFLLVFPGFIEELGDFNESIKNLSIKGFNYFSSTGFCFIYYFIGSYIKKYHSSKNSLKTNCIWIVVLIVSLVLHSIIDLQYLHLYQSAFSVGQHVYTFHNYGNIFTILTGTSIFMLLKNIMIKNKVVSKSLTFVGSLTFEMYLGLTIADQIVKILTSKFNIVLTMNIQSYFIWFIIEFVSILLMAIIYYYSKKLVIYLYNKIKVLINKKMEVKNVKKC